MFREHVAHLYSRAPFDVKKKKKLLNWFHVCFHFILFTSLAVHPDKITIATGQVAGTSSDGKVSERDWYFITLVSATELLLLEWGVMGFAVIWEIAEKLELIHSFCCIHPHILTGDTPLLLLCPCLCMLFSPGSSWLLMYVCGTLSASTHSMFWAQASLTEPWSAWLSPSR